MGNCGLIILENVVLNIVNMIVNNYEYYLLSRMVCNELMYNFVKINLWGLSNSLHSVKYIIFTSIY